MTEEEVKQNLIDKYIDLLRIKAAETAVNKELDFQIAATKLKLSSYDLNLEELEKMALGV